MYSENKGADQLRGSWSASLFPHMQKSRFSHNEARKANETMDYFVIASLWSLKRQHIYRGLVAVENEMHEKLPVFGM